MASNDDDSNITALIGSKISSMSSNNTNNLKLNNSVIVMGIVIGMLALAITSPWVLLASFIVGISLLCGYVVGTLVTQVDRDVYGKIAAAVTERAIIAGENRSPFNNQLLYYRSYVPFHVSERVDDIWKRLLDLFSRDFILYWYSSLSCDESFVEEVNLFLSSSAMNFVSYAKSRVDLASLFTYRVADAAIMHMCEFKKIQNCNISRDEYFFSSQGQSYLHYAARSENNEAAHLKRMAELLLVRLAPAEEFSSGCLRYLFRSMLDRQCLRPAVHMLCDPDYINQCIVAALAPKRHIDRDLVVTVEVVEASGLPVMDRSGASDPYCRVKLINVTYRTRVVEHTLNPRWAQRCSFRVPYDSTLASAAAIDEDGSFIGVDGIGIDTLEITVFDWNKIVGDDPIGSVIIPLVDFIADNDVVDGAAVRREYAVLSDRKKVGVLVVELRVTAGEFPQELIAAKQRKSLYSKDDENDYVLEEDATDTRPQVMVEQETAQQVENKLQSRFKESEARHQCRNSIMKKIKKKYSDVPVDLSDLLHSNSAFIYFMEFMEVYSAGSLLQFWVNSENFYDFSSSLSPTPANQKLCKQEAFNIFTVHFSPGAPLPVPCLDKSVRMRIEKGLVDASHVGVRPDCFMEAHNVVFKVMKDQYFPKFMKSEIYANYLVDTSYLRASDVGVETAPDSCDDDATIDNVVTRNGFDSINNNPAHSTIENTFSDNAAVISPSNDLSHILNEDSGNSICNNAVKSSDTTSNTGVVTPKLEKVTETLISTVETESTDTANTNNDSSSADCNGRNAIGAAVALLKEQQLIVEEALESALLDGDSSQIKYARNMKADLNNQLDHLLMSLEELPTTGVTAELKPNITSARLVSPSSRLKPFVEFVIEVERLGINGNTGWVIQRKYVDFLDLHTKLCDKFAKVKKMIFPTLPKKLSDSLVQRIHVQLGHYLQLLASDELLCASAPLRDFLRCDSVGLDVFENYNRDVAESVNKVVKSATNKVKDLVDLLGEVTNIKHAFSKEDQTDTCTESAPTVDPIVNSTHSRVDSTHSRRMSTDVYSPRGDVYDVHAAFNHSHLNLTSSVEGIPGARESHFAGESGDILLNMFFAVMEEVFDLNDKNQWLRRQAIYVLRQILQQTYGAAINNAINEQLDYLTSEDLAVHVLTMIENSLWPDGVWGDPLPSRTEEEKEQTRKEAKALLLRNIPDSVRRMVGRLTCMTGVTKVFELLQDERLNRHFLFVTLDAFLNSLFQPLRSPSSIDIGKNEEISKGKGTVAVDDVANLRASKSDE